MRVKKKCQPLLKMIEELVVGASCVVTITLFLLAVCSRSTSMFDVDIDEDTIIEIGPAGVPEFI
jgi:hypothetical protein